MSDFTLPDMGRVATMPAASADSSILETVALHSNPEP